MGHQQPEGTLIPIKVLQHLLLRSPIHLPPSPLPCSCINPEQLQSPQLRVGLYWGLISCDLVLIRDSPCHELLRAMKSHPMVLEIICGPHRSYLDRDVHEVHKTVYVGTCMEVRLIPSETLKPHSKINDFSQVTRAAAASLLAPGQQVVLPISRQSHTEEAQCDG